MSILSISPQDNRLFSAEIASKLGDINAAVIVQQLYYWMGKEGVGTVINGIKYVYNSFNDWVKQFPWLSVWQFRKAMNRLRELGIVQVIRYKSRQWNQTNYYTLNSDRLLEFLKPKTSESIEKSDLCVDADREESFQQIEVRDSKLSYIESKNTIQKETAKSSQKKAGDRGQSLTGFPSVRAGGLHPYECLSSNGDKPSNGGKPRPTDCHHSRALNLVSHQHINLLHPKGRKAPAFCLLPPASPEGLGQAQKISNKKFAADSFFEDKKEEEQPREEKPHQTELNDFADPDKPKLEANQQIVEEEKNLRLCNTNVTKKINSKWKSLLEELDGIGVQVNKTVINLVKMYSEDEVRSAISLLKIRKREKFIPNLAGYFTAALKGNWTSSNLGTQEDTGSDAINKGSVFRLWYDLAKELGYCTGQEIRDEEQWVLISGTWEKWEDAVNRGYSLDYLKKVKKRN